jgi:hypothetical protein
VVEDSKVRTFGFILVSLIAKNTEVRGDNIEFLTDGIDGLIESGMTVLIWPLGRWNRRLQAPMLLKQDRSARVRAKKELIATEIENFALGLARTQGAQLESSGFILNTICGRSWSKEEEKRR